MGLEGEVEGLYRKVEDNSSKGKLEEVFRSFIGIVFLE